MKPFDPARVAPFVAEGMSAIVKRQLDERGRKSAEDSEWIVELLLDGMCRARALAQARDHRADRVAVRRRRGLVRVPGAAGVAGRPHGLELGGGAVQLPGAGPAALARHLGGRRGGHGRR